jgi:hypothetical protein
MANGKSHGTLAAMASRHLGKAESTRVPVDTADAAHRLLADRGWTVHAFLAAALTALIASPDRLLALLADHRPPGVRTGRPPKRGTDPPSLPPEPATEAAPAPAKGRKRQAAAPAAVDSSAAKEPPRPVTEVFAGRAYPKRP